MAPAMWKKAESTVQRRRSGFLPHTSSSRSRKTTVGSCMAPESRKLERGGSRLEGGQGYLRWGLLVSLRSSAPNVMPKYI